MRFRVILFQEQGIWLGQCVEKDFCVESPNKTAIAPLLAQEIVHQVRLDKEHNRIPLEDIPKSPECFWERVDEECFLSEVNFSLLTFKFSLALYGLS